MFVGTGDFKYEVVENWAKWPEGWLINNTVWIEQNSKGIFYVLNRSEHPIIMLSKDGDFLGSWGEGEFGNPHGLFITPDDCVWITDMAWHICKKFTADGKLLMQLGTKGKRADTGATSKIGYWEVIREAGPFSEPTHAVEAPWGDIYVADGYSNVRVHVFSSKGELKFSWGERGEKPGQFLVPHNIIIDEQGNIMVAEMEGMRVQIFTRDGKFIDQWTGLDRPAAMCRDKHGNFYIPQIGEHNLLMTGRNYGRPLCKSPRIDILNPKGKVIGSLGPPRDVKLSDAEQCAPGNFAAPHGCCVDKDDNFYITEPIATHSYRLPPDCHTLQKFRRIH